MLSVSVCIGPLSWLLNWGKALGRESGAGSSNTSDELSTMRNESTRRG